MQIPVSSFREFTEEWMQIPVSSFRESHGVPVLAGGATNTTIREAHEGPMCKACADIRGTRHQDEYLERVSFGIWAGTDTRNEAGREDGASNWVQTDCSTRQRDHRERVVHTERAGNSDS